MVKTPEVSVFAGMHEVRPGGIVRVRRSGLRKSTYWRLEAREHTDDLEGEFAGSLLFIHGGHNSCQINPIPMGLDVDRIQ